MTLQEVESIVCSDVTNAKLSLVMR